MLASSYTILALSLPLLVLLPLVARRRGRGNLKQPPWLSETLPFISNAWQFMANKKLFAERLGEALKNASVVQCRLGPLKVNMITGSSNISAIFRPSLTSTPWLTLIFQNTAGYEPADLAKFAQDGSGKGKLGYKGSAGPSDPEKRIWHAMHRVYEENMMRNHQYMALGSSFQSFFDRELTLSPIGKWVEGVRMFQFLKQSMAAAATKTTFGTRILEVNPGLIDALWDYERFGETLAFGLPHWLNRRGVQARDRFRGMYLRWFELANKEFDWENDGVHTGWEPIFGSQVSREIARWAKSFDFSALSTAAAYTLFSLKLHANTIPICGWVMMELVQNPSLFQALKQEISQSGAIGGGIDVKIDHQKLLSLPLLQSVYIEALRLHTGVLITRTSTEPVTISGFNFPKGSIFQAPTEMAHLDESTWGAPNHPASEFWGHRHVKEKETTDETGQIKKKIEFSVAGRAGSLFPYGGGIEICPGRNYAKAEMLIVIAMMVSRFEIEFSEWLKPDGSTSERLAMNDVEYTNAGAVPPDREMKVRWRRVW